MARLARVLAVGIAHHITQRGNVRSFVLDSDADREVYRTLLHEQSSGYGLSLLGYCLISNHIHLMAVPQDADSLAQTMKYTLGRYAVYRNAVH